MWPGCRWRQSPPTRPCRCAGGLAGLPKLAQPMDSGSGAGHCRGACVSSPVHRELCPADCARCRRHGAQTDPVLAQLWRRCRHVRGRQRRGRRHQPGAPLAWSPALACLHTATRLACWNHDGAPQLAQSVAAASRRRAAPTVCVSAAAFGSQVTDQTTLGPGVKVRRLLNGVEVLYRPLAGAAAKPAAELVPLPSRQGSAAHDDGWPPAAAAAEAAAGPNGSTAEMVAADEGVY